ncbi:MAG: hypothetical protein AB7T06_18795 [Kofleriaceae bacterium]
MRALALVALFAACGTSSAPPPVIDDTDAEARLRYPDLAALYDGEQGLYRGCGPNGGVCHNGNEFPNLDSLGSIIGNIGVPCNQKQGSGDRFHDMCERRGDLVQFGNEAIGFERIEVGYFEPHPTLGPQIWRMVMRDAPTKLLPQEAGYKDEMRTFRRVPDGVGGEVEVPFVPMSLTHDVYQLDADDPTGRSILMLLPGGAGFDIVSGFLGESQLPRPDRFNIGDPNRNRTFGYDIGGRLIKPGDPERSYLMRRLTDPTVGTLMPRANCCSWTRASVRALWCWIDGLADDGSNAKDPIDYDACRASPAVELIYPEPGPQCEAQGLCPVSAGANTDDATFSSIYSEILTAKCAGSTCHDTEAPNGVDFRSPSVAYESLSSKIVAGDPSASPLWIHLDPALCTGDCLVMPLGRAPLPARDLERIHAWITDGAPEN